MTRYKLNLFGEFQLHGPRSTAIPVSAKKARALLAYLALQTEAMQQREYLAGLLWEECSSAQARHNLRQTISLLRKQLPGSQPLLVSNQQSIALHRDMIDIDACTFDRLCDNGDEDALQQAFDLYRGELLKGLYTGSQGFDDWLETERSQRREKALQMMDLLLHKVGVRAELEQMIRLGIAILSLDPLRESAHRLLMEAYHKQGRRGAALKQYHQCQQLLRNELGIAPEPATQALFHTLYRQAGASKPAALSVQAADSVQPPVDGTVKPGENIRHLRQISLLNVQLHHLESVQDPESEYLQDDQVRRELQHCLEKFQADLFENQHSGLLILFGLAVARTHDTEAAVRAAFAIQERLQQQSFCSAGIGVSSGRLFIPDSFIPDPSQSVQQNTSLSGAPVRQAMQLAQLASPGQILCSERAYVTISGLVKAERISGKDAMDKKPVWQLSALKQSPQLSEVGMVGRDFELQQFNSVIQSCRETGSGKILLVRGAPGIGKTRLLQEWQKQAGAAGFACHAVAVYAFGIALDQKPMQLLLRSLLKLTPDCTAEEIESHVVQAVDNGLLDNEQLDFIFDRLNKPELLRDSGLYYAMENEARQQGKLDVVNTLVQRSSLSRPLVLIVEDIHWAEPQLLTALGEIVDGISHCPIVMVFSTRLEEEPQDPLWRSRLQNASLLTLDISPLSNKEAALMADQALCLSDGKRQRLIERAGGNPLFLEQLLLYAREAADMIPDSVQNIIAAKLDTLDAFDKRALFAASILGQRFSEPALNFILGDTDYRCATLVGRGLVRPDGAQFQFHHALIMEGIYATQLPSQRRSLHRLAADWYREKDPLLYASHLDKAESEDAAGAYLAAAHGLMRAYQYDEAEKLARRGREIAVQGKALFDLCLCQANCLRELGQTQASLEIFISAEQLATTPAQQYQALIGQGFALRLKDRHEEILALTNKAESLVAAMDDSAAQATLYCLRGGAFFFLGFLNDCLKAHQRAEALAVSHDQPLILARAMSGIGDAWYGMGRMRDAERKFRQCIVLCQQHDLITDAAINQLMAAVIRSYSNHLEEAENDMLEALAWVKNVKSRRTEAMCLVELAYLSMQKGQPATARAYAERGLLIARELGSRRIECDSLQHIGLVDENEDLLEQAYAIASANTFGRFYNSSWILATLAWVTDDAEKCAWALRQGETLLSAQSLSHNHLMFYRYAIEASLKNADFARAEYFAAGLQHYTRAEPLPWSEFFIHRANVLIRADQGEASAALAADLNRLVEEANQAGLHEAKQRLVAALQRFEKKEAGLNLP